MTIRQGLVLVGALAFAVGLGSRLLVDRSIVHAGPETESRFIQIYDPTIVTNSFRSRCGFGDGFGGVSTSRSSSPGSSLIGYQRAVEHHLSVIPRFCGNVDRVLDLMANLQKSVGNALRGSGCQVSAGWLMTGPDIHITYHCGAATTGVVNAHVSPAFPGDPLHMALSFQVDERWL